MSSCAYSDFNSCNYLGCTYAMEWRSFVMQVTTLLLLMVHQNETWEILSYTSFGIKMFKELRKCACLKYISQFENVVVKVTRGLIGLECRLLMKSMKINFSNNISRFKCYCFFQCLFKMCLLIMLITVCLENVKIALQS